MNGPELSFNKAPVQVFCAEASKLAALVGSSSFSTIPSRYSSDRENLPASTAHWSTRTSIPLAVHVTVVNWVKSKAATSEIVGETVHSHSEVDVLHVE